MSVSVWARSDSYARGGQYIVAWGDGRISGGCFLVAYNGADDHCIYGSVGGYNIKGGHSPQADGLWHHVAMVTDGNVVSTYIDGKFANSADTSNGINVKSMDDVSIGQGWGSGCLDGAIDEVMIFDRALSDSEVKQIYDASNVDGVPSREGPIAFGGVDWAPLRTLFEVQGDRLVSLPKARPGFNYGHGGNGRGPWLMTNIGNEDWKDYSLQVEYCMTGIDAAFNPYGLPADCRGGGIMFHLADFKESWNESGWSTYRLGLGADGTWNLGCLYNMYCHVSSGYGEMRADGERTLAEGKGLKIDPKNGNKVRIDVRGTRIMVWVDGEKIADVNDEKMRDAIGGKTLDHGGIGFDWIHDSMGWIRNFSVTKM